MTVQQWRHRRCSYILCKIKLIVAKLDTRYLPVTVRGKLKRVEQLIPSSLCTSTFSSRCSSGRREMVELRHRCCRIDLHMLSLYSNMLVILQNFDQCPRDSLPKNCWPQAAATVKPLVSYQRCQFYSWTPALLSAAVTVAEASSRVLAFFTVLKASTMSPSCHSSKSSTPIPHSSPAPT